MCTHIPDPAANPSPSSYADVPRFMAVSQAMAQPQGTLVGICARVVCVEQCHGARSRGGHRLRLADLGGFEMFETLPLLHLPHLLHKAWDAVQKGYPIIIYGTFPSYPKSHESYDGPKCRLEITDLRRLTRQTSLLAPLPDELAATDELLQRLWAEPDGFLRHAISAGRRFAGLVQDNLAPRFQLGEELTVLQALSYGMVNPALNSRLAVFVISGPATGKDRLAQYVQLFSPLFDQIQPTQVTPAGLGASVAMKASGWEATPGALPKVSGGALVLDDIHRVEQKALLPIQGLLMSVIEEGRVRPCKAGSATYDARAAVFITANRRSVRDGRSDPSGKQSTPQERAADIGLPMDLLSRMDIVLHMGLGDDALRSAMKIASQEAFAEHRPEDHEDLPTRPGLSEEERWQRQIKLLFARAKDLIPVVELGAIEDQLEDGALLLGVLNREATARLRGVDEAMYDGDGLSRRMSNSLRKLVGALSRVQGRKAAEAADVKRAVEILALKLEVVRYVAGDTDRIRPLPPVEQQAELVRLASEERWQKLMGLFAGMKVQLPVLLELWGCTERAARRELTKRGIEPEGTWYQLPTVEGYKKWQAEQQDKGLRGEVAPPPRDEQPDLPPPPPPPEPKKEWNDCLPVPPKEVQPIVELMPQMDGDSQAAVADMVYEAALHEHPTAFVALLVKITAIVALWGQDTDTAVPYEPLEATREWLLHGAADWSTRGMKLMGLYAAAGMKETRYRLEDSLKRRPGEAELTPELAAGAEALRTRMEWQWQEELRKVMEELDKRPPPPPPLPSLFEKWGPAVPT